MRKWPGGENLIDQLSEQRITSLCDRLTLKELSFTSFHRFIGHGYGDGMKVSVVAV